jgi:isopentenyl diphosphate isomerase/L-lactate dehydrogenase-like FMN-dependent dehydrogenase
MSNDNPNFFLSDQNIRILWEVILDDDIVVNKNREEITQINGIFLRVAQQFYDNERSVFTSLFEMNKKFISLIVNILSKNFPKPKQLSILEVIEPITAEEIQTKRATEFEQTFAKKQEEFTNAMTLPVPPTPNFSDNAKDEPIGELELIIKRTIAERNLEMQKIQTQYNKADVEKWIGSQETSVRVEKTRDNDLAMKTISLTKNTSEYATQQQQDATQSRHISWAEDIENHSFNKESDTNTNVNIHAKIDNLERKVDALHNLIERILTEKNKN